MQQQCHCAERQQIVKKGLQKLAGHMNDSLETPPTEVLSSMIAVNPARLQSEPAACSEVSLSAHQLYKLSAGLV